MSDEKRNLSGRMKRFNYVIKQLNSELSAYNIGILEFAFMEFPINDANAINMTK